MEKSYLLQECKTISEAAKLVTNGTAMFTSEQLAGQYAFEAASDGDDLSDDSLIAHLDVLLYDGDAEFDPTEALAIAKQWVNQNDSE